MAAAVAAEQIQSSGLVENVNPRSKADIAGDVLHGAKISVSGSANFISAMTMSDLFNAAVTTIAHNRGANHALPGMPTTDGITDVQGGDFFSSAIVAGGIAGAWAIAGMVGLSIFIIGNIYMTLHKRLNAHHNAVITIHKCYGILLRIENFLKVAQKYCEEYNFQIDSLEIQEDLINIYKLLDEITTPDDVYDVYTNLIQGKTFRLETVNGNVIPVPEVKPAVLGRIKYFANTFAGIRRITVNINNWTTKFNSIMIELNTHLTLLIGEFFMLSNLHQLTSDHQKNSKFAADLLIPSENNPVWCIELQIMLAPILRARIIVFSCALSTNTALCHQTINSEMQELDKASDLGIVTRLKAYVEKMYRLYKTGLKQINIRPFIDTIKNAVYDVENSAHYGKLPQEYNMVKVCIQRIKENLKGGPLFITQENVTNIVDALDDIHRIVLECGRLNKDRHALIEPFHSVQRSIAGNILPKQFTHKNFRKEYELQTRPFSYKSQDYSSIHAIKRILDNVCEQATRESVDYSSYDVASYYNETESQTAIRIKTSYPESPENVEYMAILKSTQHQYNRLYAHVRDIDPNARGLSGIVVKRGRDMAACILLLERICVHAITITTGIIREICQKCNRLFNKDINVAQVNMLSMFGPDTAIHQVIAHVLDLSQPVIQRPPRGDPVGYARLVSLSPVNEAQEQKEDLAAAAIQQSSIISGTSSNGKQKDVKPTPARPFVNFFTGQGSSIGDPRANRKQGGKRGVRTCKIKKIKSNKMYKTSRRHRNRSHRKGSRCKHANYTRRQNN